MTADERRREFVLNCLLCGLLCLGLFANSIAFINHFITGLSSRPQNIISTILFTSVVAILLYVSRRVRPIIAAYAFQAFLLISALLFVMAWSYRLPEAQLVFALMIVIAGVLFKSTIALVASLVATFSMFTIAALQISGVQKPYTAWMNAPLSFFDLAGYAAIFIAMGIVSWLSNRETDRSLQRAQISERDLKVERDGLEVKVANRTKQLEDLQVARLLEMQPLAEFGRISAGLVHEIANPLTALRLQLEILSQQQPSTVVTQAKASLSQLEEYLDAARKQLKRETSAETFIVGREVKQTIALLTHRANQANTHITVHGKSRLRLKGDVVKFHQIIANLTVNAIDACEQLNTEIDLKTIRIVISGVSHNITITVDDEGIGMTQGQLANLFKQFYTTKASLNHGLGIGLSLVKQSVEQDFGGTITAVSKPGVGTTFSVVFRGTKF